jgi:hypothetical protein
MPAAAVITLADAAATPVTHTFTPVGKDVDGISYRFTDQSQASPIGFWQITIALKQPPAVAAPGSTGTRVYRALVTLSEPILENTTNSTVSGVAPAPTISYTPRVTMEFLLPERSALLDRQSLRKMAYNLLANAQVIAAVENLQSIY